VEPRDREYLHEAESDVEPEVQPIEAPDGLDLNPQPRRAVRISKRASIAIISVIVLLLGAFAYGGYRRTQAQQATAREAGVPKGVAPATQAGTEFLRAIPPGNAPLTRSNAPDLLPPLPVVVPCAVDPKAGQAYQYDPQTGRPCDGLPPERVVVRQPPVARIPPPEPLEAHPEPTPEERRIAAAYQREQEAILSPTGIRTSQTTASSASQLNPTGANDIAALAALNQAPALRTLPSSMAPVTQTEYDDQNMQTRKEEFLAAASRRQTDDYLRSTRAAPLSRFEIKAGWEIPAILEQSLNSDLPGELKALVTSNVYDTATGLYLLIPQGSRLVGKYDSRISYGQDGVQVAWSRIIYPDASSIDLDGMLGVDSQGNAGLRDKVDRHYRRIVGFSVLTSLFTAAFSISQRQSQSALAYPTAGQTAASAVGQELSQTGAQITRRNLNVQPTIKVPAGYRFNVRVNRDILFESPYEPAQAQRPTRAGK
jgi:type IV secretion system protein VirB10